MPDMLMYTSADSLSHSMAVTSFVSSFDMSTANTCCVQLLRLTVMTPSALPHLAWYSFRTVNVSTSASAVTTPKSCSCDLAPLLCLADKAQLGMEGHPAVRACVMCVPHFD